MLKRSLFILAILCSTGLFAETIAPENRAFSFDFDERGWSRANVSDEQDMCFVYRNKEILIGVTCIKLPGSVYLTPDYILNSVYFFADTCDDELIQKIGESLVLVDGLALSSSKYIACAGSEEQEFLDILFYQGEDYLVLVWVNSPEPDPDLSLEVFKGLHIFKPTLKD